MEKKTVVRPGRVAQEKKVMQLPVSGLKVGMYVRELDRPWLETPFILQGFPIRSVEDIEEIAKHCEWVIVEVGEEVWQPAQERVLQEARKPRTLDYTPSTTSKDELGNAKAAHQNARALTRSFMDDVRLGRGIDIKEVKATVSECVRSVLRNPDAMMWMSRLRSKDEYTSEHSLNVGLLAITFGRHLGASEEDLNKLGVAGMLHDVGKMQTPNDILLKEAKLSDEEFQLMKMHAQQGRDILLAHRNIYHGAIDVAYSHHENLDGSGYPRGLKSGGITDFTRIVALCDVYDAITSDRAYKKGASSLNALKIIQDEAGKKFDVRLAQEFIECIGLYPPGSIVELHNGEVGIVVGTNYRHRHLPKVMIVRSVQKQACQERILNMEKIAASGATEQLIKNVLPNGIHGIRVETFVEKGLLFD
ncbi:MAG TPA: HD-GYP domain-containing protein [Spongiibacteraceae bacterium]|nr:HD-GYP domain-containing protein [Spongiibacteraceae bacterium]